MAEIECTTRKWGNSLGIILPKEIVNEEDIAENEKIMVGIKKKHLAKEFFGLLHGWKRPTEEIKREMKKGW
ncbi:AbrB/MazE/SpoVT family DNA-binding domain-containing protein [Candidatus Woesearchaeota archaeon]|nr:AbrB/MazE/SpoVT family DNA-binding domain-containing protein [Candidatus Woesearchaeota archaeon]